jgi:hypothetical protein
VIGRLYFHKRSAAGEVRPAPAPGPGPTQSATGTDPSR